MLMMVQFIARKVEVWLRGNYNEVQKSKVCVMARLEIAWMEELFIRAYLALRCCNGTSRVVQTYLFLELAGQKRTDTWAWCSTCAELEVMVP